MRVSQFAGLVALSTGTAAAPTLRSSSPYAVKERHAVPPSWSVVGEAAKSHMLNLQIGLKQSNRDILEQQVIEVSDPGHSRYGQHLSAEEVNALVAPAEDTLHLVTKWLREHGITEPQLSPAKDWIHVAIPVAKAEELLNTTYSHFKHVDGSDIVRTAEWSLPEHLHEHVDVIQPTTSFFKTSRQSNDIAPDDSERWWQPMPPQYHVGPSLRIDIHGLTLL